MTDRELLLEAAYRVKALASDFERVYGPVFARLTANPQEGWDTLNGPPAFPGRTIGRAAWDFMTAGDIITGGSCGNLKEEADDFIEAMRHVADPGVAPG